ncbi:MAG: hemolysin family protein [Bacillota bacterium]|nr:hemolysin family protein [Bacillota bacterium]
MSIAISLLLVVFFLLMNAFFVVAEFSLVRVRKSQVDMLVANGVAGAKYAQLVSANVNAYLSACQLGITLASLALGWLGEPAVSDLIRPLLSKFGLSEAVISTIAVAIGFIIITAFHIVVGELIPKSLAILKTERWALRSAPLLVWFYRLTYPIMLLFNAVTNGAMRLMGHKSTEENQAYTDEEIKLLMAESSDSGLLDPQQYRYMDNIFDLGDKDAEAIMTPRTDMVCLYLEDPLEEDLKVVNQYKYTRFPVCSEEKDNIIGFVHIKDLFTLPPGSDKSALKIRPLEAVPEGISAGKLLRMFQKKKTKIAVVIDEHGGTSGIVTLSDIFAVIVGRMDDEYLHDDEEEFVELSQGHYLVDGALPIDVFADRIDLNVGDVPEYDTVGGFLLELFDRIPSTGDKISYQNMTFIVREMENRRIIRVEVVQESIDEPDED